MPKKETTFLKKLTTIKRWQRGDIRAPHKPLLLLLTLARTQQNKNRLTPFTEIEYDLKSLIETYGPSRKSHHPEFPFWYLQNDEVWEIPGKEMLRPRKGSSSPTAKTLRDGSVEGGLPEEYHSLLVENPDLITRAAETILEAHFPPSMHDDLLDRVGLSLKTSTTKKRARDPDFRGKVLVAYEYRCAVCGHNARIDNMPMGLEAAHVRWHSHAGPSTVDNGLCLCTLHHKAFDLGAIALSEKNRILISQHLHGGNQVDKSFLAFSGRSIIGPQKGQPHVAQEHRSWHMKNCFKGPARGLDR